MANCDLTNEVIDMLQNVFGAEVRDTLNTASAIDNVPAWDSLSFIEIIEAAEFRFNITISASDADSLHSVASIVDLIERKSSGRSS